MAPLLSAGARHWRDGPARPRPGPRPPRAARGGSAQRRSASSPAPHLGTIPLPNPARGGSARAPPSNLFRTVILSYILSSYVKGTERPPISSFNLALFFLFFPPFPADPPESGREISRDRERGSEAGGQGEETTPFPAGLCPPVIWAGGAEALLPHHSRLAAAAGPAATPFTASPGLPRPRRHRSARCSPARPRGEGSCCQPKAPPLPPGHRGADAAGSGRGCV